MPFNLNYIFRNRPSFSKRHKYVFSMLFISFIFFLLSLLFSHIFNKETVKIDNTITDKILRQANNSSTDISQLFNGIKSATAHIEKALTQKKLTDKEIRALIENSVNQTFGAYRGGVVFKKERFNASEPLYSPYYQKFGNNLHDQQISDSYDYTQKQPTWLRPILTGQEPTPSSAWFYEPLNKGAMWLEPYYGEIAGGWLSEYIRPFIANYDNDYSNGYDGIIFMNASLAKLSEITARLKLENSGFAFILSHNNAFISYPDKSLLGKPLQQLANEKPFIDTLLKQKQQASLSRFIHPINQKESWLIFQPIKDTKFTLGVLIWAQELRASHGIENLFPYDRLSQLCQIIALILWISCGFYPKRHKALFYVHAIIISFTLGGALFIICYDKLNSNISQNTDNQVYEKVNIDNLLLKLPHQPPDQLIKHPIKLTLNSMTFSSPSTLELIGKISLPSTLAEQNAPPLYFPMAQQTRWEQINPKDNTWKFSVSIKQPFNYASFPFDREVIQLSMKLKENDVAGLLTPHFKAYASMLPTSLAGINQATVELNGWTLDKSFFSYQIEQQTLNTLVFNLVIERNLTGPFITYFFPLLMTVTLTYFTLLMWTKDRKQLSLWGFSLSSVLARSSSLFFILILSHIALRDALEAKGMIFMELYFLAAYSLLIGVTISSMLYLANSKLFIINYQDGLLLKVLYWPYFLLFCIIATLHQLY